MFLQVAIKSIRKEKIKDEQDLVHIRREIEIMSTLCHPHIITIYEGSSRTKSNTLTPLTPVCATLGAKRDTWERTPVNRPLFGTRRSVTQSLLC